MPSRAAVILAVSLLTVALICSLTSASRLEAISQPSQGGGYPNCEATTGATPDCLVTPKKYELYAYDRGYDNHMHPPTPLYRTYSELQCCKTSYSGPNLQAQTTWCANYYEWKSQNTAEDIRVYGFPAVDIDDHGYLPPGHAYLKSIANGGESISPPFATGPPPTSNATGAPPSIIRGTPVPGLLNLTGNNTSPKLFGSVGNTTNSGNNTGTLPPGSIFKIPPGTTSVNNPGNATNPSNSTGTPPALTVTKEHNPASPNVLSLAGNNTNPSNKTGNPNAMMSSDNPPGCSKQIPIPLNCTLNPFPNSGATITAGSSSPTGNATNAPPSAGNNTGPLSPLGSIIKLPGTFRGPQSGNSSNPPV